jgi:hypothetical protein
MSCLGHSDCTCGCCTGISVRTPNGEINPPGLSSIAYRTGTWATFKDSMLARLSSSDYPALVTLRTRDNDDFSIALLDATSVVLDILTFYQERLANESYLRTATQLDSLTQLTRLIGYQPAPGVSSSTYLAFTLSAATGLPANPGMTAVTIPLGTQVQSVPPQGQLPQSFETSVPILAKPDWNAMPVQTGVPWKPAAGQTSVYLQGTATQLIPGDAILIVGDERLNDFTSPIWDVRIVSTVQPDVLQARTLVTWIEPLGATHPPAQQNPKFYALRQRASLFGFNALHPLMLSAHNRAVLQADYLVSTGTGASVDWIFDGDATNINVVDLDSVYAKVTPHGWLVLNQPNGDTTNSPSGLLNLFYINSVVTTSRASFGMSAKVTRVTTDAVSLLTQYYNTTRSTAALVHSEELAVAEQPLDHPLYGTLLDLEGVRQDLVGVTAVAVTGKSQRVTVNTGVNTLVFTPDDGTAEIKLRQGATLTLLQPPANVLNDDGTIPDWQTHAGYVTLVVVDSSGRSGTVMARLEQLSLTLAGKNDPMAQEFALISSVAIVTEPFARTRIILKSSLVHCYDRTATTVNANVGPATAGRSVTELLGNGSAATPNQRFTLKQPPLTYTSAATPTGRASSLLIRANGAAWKEVPVLYQQSPDAQVYETMNLAGGTTVVQFGDGVEGATLPTGQSNIVANYRVGLGASGNVAAGTITTLVDRPIGVKGVTNPMPATGGQDAQSAKDIRTNAPQSMLTLGRAVSITDYQNFAANFAGIAKASALWIPNGVRRGVFITVAGVDGVQLQPDSATLANLVSALQKFGNPHVAVYVQSFYETIFCLSADIAYDPAYDATAVRAVLLTLLKNTYNFASRTFGQGVSGDEIAALIQSVPGVMAANVTKLQVVATSSAGDLGNAAFSVSAYNNWIAGKQQVTRPTAGDYRICPYIPVPQLNALPAPAEILVLDPDPASLVLGVMA